MIYGKIKFIIAAGASLVLFNIQSAATAPITFNTALPVARDELLLRVQTKYMHSTDDPSNADRDLIVWSVPVVAAYGITEKLALFGILPVLDKNMELSTSVGRMNRGGSGIGDFTAMARYTVWKKDLPGRTTRLAPFVALEIPSGKDNEADSLGRLPQPLQLGSGSWDPAIGLVLTRQDLSRQIDISLSYKFNTLANNFKFGDIGRLDLSYQHRVWPTTLSSGVPGFLYGVLESNFVWQDKNKVIGVEDDNSGGVSWLLAPGIQYVTQRTVAEFAVQIPVAQNLNGSALENDFISTLSFRMKF